MIKFNQNKFPHKYAECWDNKQMSLCTYVWKLLFTMLVYWSGAAALAVAGFVIVWGFVVQMIVLFSDVTFSVVVSHNGLWGFCLFMFYVAAATSTLLAVVGFSAEIANKVSGTFDKTDSLVVEYIRAKKQKFCPTVKIGG